MFLYEVAKAFARDAFNEITIDSMGHVFLCNGEPKAVFLETILTRQHKEFTLACLVIGRIKHPLVVARC